VLAALVGVAQLGADRATPGRRLPLYRLVQRAGEPGRGQLGRRGGIGLVDRAHQRADAASVARRDEVLARETQEVQLAVDLVLDALARVRIGEIPLVDGQYQRATGIQHVT